MSSIYEATVDADAENNAHSHALHLVGFNKSVLEVGCSTGYFTRALVDRGCRVVGVEIDPDTAAVAATWADEVVVGDLEHDEVWDRLEGRRFDAVLFGDVLEHLHDPLTTLRRAVRLVAPSGTVVISMPNVAHGDVRMALLQGSFPYRDTGLLDRTHLRFFTKESIRELCVQAGLVIVDTERVIVPLFQTELGVIRDDFSQSTIDQILEDPEAETYQFVVKAVPDNGDRAVATLAERVAELADHAHHEVVRAALLAQELRDHDELRRQVDEYRRQVDALLSTKTYRLLAPLRSLYARLIASGHTLPGPSGGDR
jgi:2-polyprenyl-3-methyl-5-hydroxy-6-metoxy-1,4-benzoquinol methylase